MARLDFVMHFRRSGEFEMLITIPYYEWNEVEGKREREEEYVKRKLMRDF